VTDIHEPIPAPPGTEADHDDGGGEDGEVVIMALLGSVHGSTSSRISIPEEAATHSAIAVAFTDAISGVAAATCRELYDQVSMRIADPDAPAPTGYVMAPNQRGLSLRVLDALAQQYLGGNPGAKLEDWMININGRYIAYHSVRTVLEAAGAH
jgi:hypothetical protein